MTESEILQKTAHYVEEKLTGEGSGHDWWHIVRVRQMAERLAVEEGANSFICEMAALVHDLADEKVAGSEEAGLAEVHRLLDSLGLSDHQTQEILMIIQGISYKGGTLRDVPLTLEGKIVQDADRLDAIGAIGIARTMVFSGHKQRPIHDPQVAVREQMTLEEYRSNQGTAISHFYEKLLKLKDLMNTETAKRLAQGRHEFLESYLEQFYAEWEARR
ncbi:HD domain-containing protein [Streptococcus ovis]|uniref:HD domain-containing protein n=1 Tax=Streptococcus ovis TaxID=82806 RepID=UPI0003741686|nr:HD domain-containing protein [Streptococcus ovis]